MAQLKQHTDCDTGCAMHCDRQTTTWDQPIERTGPPSLQISQLTILNIRRGTGHQVCGIEIEKRARKGGKGLGKDRLHRTIKEGGRGGLERRAGEEGGKIERKKKGEKKKRLAPRFQKEFKLHRGTREEIYDWQCRS